MNTNDEIDLKNLFKVIWDGKIKIFSISIISFLIGYVYYIQLPTNYSNQIVISKVGNYELFEYSSINKLMINLIGTEPSAQLQGFRQSRLGCDLDFRKEQKWATQIKD